MQKIAKKFTFLFWAVLSFFTKAGFVLAFLEIKYPTISGQTINDASTLGDYVCYFFSIGVNIAIIISATVIAYGGILYLISYNRGKFTSDAKDVIKAGIIGLLIVVSSTTILYTINPDLTKCSTGLLSPITNLITGGGSNTPGSNLNVRSFNEIPIGTLTEQLLSRTISCYGFDIFGDPIQGHYEVNKNCSTDENCSKDEWCNTYAGKCSKYFPTYENHDRADCITQLADGIQKKSQTAALLSAEIAKLMEQCSCEGKCNPGCDPADGGCRLTSCPGSCTGDCIDGECEQPQGTNDCCPEGVKEMIEHGMIKIGMNIDIVDPTYTPSDNISDNVGGECFGFNNTINGNLENRTLYVAPEFYDAAVAAASTWNNALGANLFGSVISDPSLSDYHPSISNGRNEIYSSTEMDALLPTGALGWNQNNSYTQSESDIGVGGNSPVGDASTEPGVYDLQTLLTHELGHSLGLNDQYDPGCEGAMMFGYLAPGQIKRDVSTADVSGIEQYYGITADPQDISVETGEVGEGEEGGSENNTDEENQAGDIDSVLGKEFHGLDEFRCPNPIEDAPFTSCSGIAGYVEKIVTYDGKQYDIIDQDKWDDLNIIQQLYYYQPAIEDLKKTIEDDIEELDKARSTLAKCYMAISSVDLVKIYENTDYRYTIIYKKPQTFLDPLTGEKVNSSKYCDGFNYNNSDCLKKCNDMCPDTSPEAMEAYSLCVKNDPSRSTECVKDAYLERPCIYAPDSEGGGDKDPKDFKTCISSCQNDCSSLCSQKYLAGSGEYSFCLTQCQNNSQCVLDNADKCLIDGKDFAECATDYDVTDQGNADYCIDRAYLCQNGSNEYAGYQDCANNPKSVSGDYSASYFYSNPDTLKCIKPYEIPESSSACYSSKDVSKCRDICPETQKCPTDSRCPDCSCDSIDELISFSVPNKSTKENVGREGFYNSTKSIEEYQMVGPQCNEYSYNEDPLTFYCEENWWDYPDREGLSKTPVGETRNCSKQTNIPVGQTVDSAKIWADSILDSTNNIIDKLDIVIKKLIKIGKAIDTDPIQDYCKCEAKMEDDSPICKTGCQYDQWTIFIEGAGVFPRCSCSFIPCDGEPCQQMIDYISELWNNNRDLKIEYINFYMEMLKEKRSDIMKKLTYSRQTTDDCSLVTTSYGTASRIYSCTRADDELIPPVSNGDTILKQKTIEGYCYGVDLGIVTGQDLTDDWFCCQRSNIDNQSASSYVSP